MTHDDFDPEAALADLLSGEVDVETDEGRALLERAGTTRAEFDALREVSLALEYRGVSRASSDAAEDAGGANVHAVLEDLARRPAEPRRGVARWIGPALAAAAAILLVVVLTNRTNDDPAPYRPEDSETLGGSGEAEGVPTFVVDLSTEPRSLTIPEELLEIEGGAVTVILVEEESRSEPWTEGDVLTFDTPTQPLTSEQAIFLSDQDSGWEVLWAPGRRQPPWSDFSSAVLRVR